MGVKRRAMPGHTHDPWPCCDVEAGPYGRPKRGICAACRALIVDGHRFREAALKQRSEIVQWPETDYGWPRFYEAQIPSEAREALDDAFWALVNATTSPAPASTPHLAPNDKEWPTLLVDPKKDRGYHDRWSWLKLRLVEPEVRKAINVLYRAIIAAGRATHAEAKEEGRSLLRGLAAGEITTDEFDGKARR